MRALLTTLAMHARAACTTRERLPGNIILTAVHLPLASNGGAQTEAQTESPTESPIEQKLSTISCEAQTIADMELEDGFVTATLEVYSPHELVKVEGLLDTGASVGFIREDFAESLVSRGAGSIVNTPSKVRVKLADGTVRYMDKAWKCFVKQISKQGHIVWKLLTFILMGGIGKPGIIIGRNQFKILGFAVTWSVLCNDEQRCVVDDEQAEKMATGHPTTPVRPVIVCQSLDPYLKTTECDILRISDIVLRWRQMRDCDQPYLGLERLSTTTQCVLPKSLRSPCIDHRRPVLLHWKFKREA
ncbi:hypothetical protein FOZ63_007605 [Perkinsus olseni]|uniref:Uncharacterized protein n=1 Tax=Perkinsus olseni TaxID=32597 RepID=A0A7J6PTN3_PEROL|nr:hypothetical protein FOZ60_013152 [Perkinsus olseni]KAF4699549.1 hypothetical protein FOZ63_007605 [Perkinsus olseni]